MKESIKLQPSNSREASKPRLPVHSCAHATFGACALAFFGMLTFLHAAQPGTNAPVASLNDLSSFKLITERNIFNTRRSARYVPSNREQNSTRRINRGESFALVGTMHYDKGPFAFFDGSRSDYRKVLKPDETIAGFKVAEILPSAVKLTSSTNEIELPVGMQLRREDDNSDWVKSARPESAEPAGGVSSSSHLSFQAAPPTPPPATNGDFQNAGPDGGPPLPFDPNAVQAFFNGDQPQSQTISTNVDPAAPPPPGVDITAWRMMQRRAQE